jgi:hypothetical protein
MDNYSARALVQKAKLVRTVAQLTELIEANRGKSRLLEQEARELRDELGRATSLGSWTNED